MANFKIVIRTLMAVFVLAFCATTFHYYIEQGNARAETLEPKLPDFEHTNNQQFLDNVIQCVNYIEHNTTDVYPVNLELLLAQAALESGWGNSRLQEWVKIYLVLEHMIYKNHICYLLIILKSGV